MVGGRTPKPKSKSRRDGSTGVRYEYFCGTYFKAVREGRREECSCKRNGVFQDTLEEYVGRYLEESGHRLALLGEEKLPTCEGNDLSRFRRLYGVFGGF